MAVEQTRKRRRSPPAHPRVRKVERVVPGRVIPKAYLRLLEKFMLRPLRTDDELKQAGTVADELASRQEALRPEEVEYLDVLCDLIERYEDEYVPMPDVTATDMLRFLIEQRGVTQLRVAKESGIANSTLSAVLTGSRELTAKHMEKLAAYFAVEPAVFLPGNARW